MFVLTEKTSAPIHAEPSSMVNEELLPSPPCAPGNEKLEGTEAAYNEAKKTVGAENPEAEKPTNAVVNAEGSTSPEVMDLGAGHPKHRNLLLETQRERERERGKSAQEIPITTSPSVVSTSKNVEKNPGGNLLGLNSIRGKDN
ncbi:hypothetical protein Hanom_Chr09g00762851 [Helianthus anomalus]